MIINSEDLNLVNPLRLNDRKAIIVECQKLVSQICSGSKKLHEIIEDLGTLITSKDVNLRKQSFDALSCLLMLLPNNFLNVDESHFIVKFLCSRLSDHHTVLRAVLRGILNIISEHNLPEDIPRTILSSLFQSVSCQAQPFDTRRLIYKIIEILLQNNADSLKTMGNELVVEITNAVSGEQDSKNLIIIFGLWPKLMKIFQPVSLSEEIFEVIACYFPIDYSSTSPSTINITRDDLADALIPCINAVPDCAKYCLPLISEKLNSDLKTAKLDSIRLLVDGASSYASQDLHHHFKQLWSDLQREILSGTDAEIISASSKTVVILLKALSTDDQAFCEPLISQTITDVKWIIANAHCNMFHSLTNLLTCFAEVNSKSCISVLSGFIPLFMGHYCTETSVSNKRILLQCLNHFLSLSRKWSINIKEIPELSWADIPSVYFKELHVKDLDITLKQSLFIGLAIQSDILTNDQHIEIFEAICSEVDLGDNDMKAACIDSLKIFAVQHSSEILALIECRLQLNSEVFEPTIIKRRLDAIAALSKTKDIGQKVLPIIIDIALKKVDDELGTAALTYIKNLILNKYLHFDAHKYLVEQGIINQLLSSGGSCQERMCLISNICNFIFKKLDTAIQQAVFEKSSSIIEEYIFIHNDGILFVEGLFRALRPTVKINNVENVLSRFRKISLESNDEVIRNTACRVICSIVNKTPVENTFFKATQDVLDSILHSNSNVSDKMAAVCLCAWLTKGIVARDSIDNHWLNYFINLLNDEQTGQFAAREIKTLIRNDNVFSHLSTENVAILYVQRIFEYLIQKSKNVADEHRENYLTAIGSFVKDLPSELLMLYLEDVVPLFDEALLFKKSETILEYLQALQVLLETHIQIFSQTANSLIPQILNLTSHKNMWIRSAALHCLISFSKYPVEIVGAFKEDVLLKLNDAIDDRKRLIRKLAVVSRTHWYLVDQLNEM